MIRGFLAGLISGGLLATMLAAVASLSVPLPPVSPPSGDAPVIAAGETAAPGETVAPPVAAQVPVAEAPAEAVPPVAAAAPAAPALPGPQPGAAADPAGPAPVAPAPGPEAQAVAPAAEPAADPAPAPVAGPVAPGDLALLPPAPVPAPEGSAAAPQAPGTGDAPPAQAAPGVVPAPAAPADVPLAGSTAPAVPAPETPAPEAAKPEPEPAPQPEARPADPAPEPDPAQAATTPGNPVPALPGRPQTGLGASVDGVRTGRLPRIGDAAPEVPPAAPDAGVDAAAIPEDAPALQRNARAFANPDGKPPMAILLLDDPASGVDLAALAAGPVALTLVIDPTAPDAAARAALWRAAGQEVALLADALPARGQGSDFEVAMESLATAFPQALAVVESAGRPLPTDRTSSSALISALAARGFGLVTRGGGLNALDQTARRAGLPAAAIFRALDAENEAAPVIGRYLDRIAFTAQQDGSVIVIGRLRPETVAAVQDWAAGSSRAAALALAPVSALVQAAPRPAP